MRYSRPSIDVPLFLDADGLEYGTRWHGSSPPEDSYSVDTNLERFRPLHTVAEALIEFLTNTYDVTVSEGHDDDILHPRPDIVRATRLTPSAPTAAPLTFVFTSYPSVIVHAGVITDFLHPTCGCDACDSSWETEAGDLEWRVLAVAAGKFRETSRRAWVGHSIEAVDGMQSSSANGRSNNLPWERLRSAASALKAVPNGWQPWSLRKG